MNNYSKVCLGLIVVGVIFLLPSWLGLSFHQKSTHGIVAEKIFYPKNHSVLMTPLPVGKTMIFQFTPVNRPERYILVIVDSLANEYNVEVNRYVYTKIKLRDTLYVKE